jgi:hypothetical protein
MRSFIKERIMEKRKAIIWLKAGFMFGAVVDALALIPMLIPWSAKVFWGFSSSTGSYYFAQGMGASLMLGWTILLLWAYCKPLERRYVALFTIIVVIGIVTTEIVGIYRNYIGIDKLVVSLVLQTVGLILFSSGFIISNKALEQTPLKNEPTDRQI